MKSLAAQLAHFLRKDTSRQDLLTLARLLVVLAFIVVIYSFVFHLLMLREGCEHSWFTGIYWTLTTMTTLGFGDITFSADLGRVFSMCVLMAGTVYMLILLPFSFMRPRRERATTPYVVTSLASTPKTSKDMSG